MLPVLYTCTVYRNAMPMVSATELLYCHLSNICRLLLEKISQSVVAINSIE